MRLRLEYILILLASLLSLSCQKEEIKSTTSNAIFNNSNNKLWAHKVYSSEEANLLFEDFSGLETDIVYDTSRNIFDIRHNPEDAFQNRVLDTFFNEINNANEHYYWLDFKNLDSYTVKKAILRLDYLSRKYDIKDKIIIESESINELGELSTKGYFTSYWIPHDMGEKDNFLYFFHLGKWYETENIIRENLKKYNINALSANHTIYDFLKEKFPNANVHLWTNDLKTENDKERIKFLHKQAHIKVILVDYKNNFMKK